MNNPSPKSPSSGRPPQAPEPPKQRTILISGASRGIGAALAKLRQDRGDTLLLLNRSRPAWSMAENTHHIPCDLCDLSKIPATIRAILQDHPNLDAVISNAGDGKGIATFEQLSPTQIESSLRLNLNAHIHLSRAVWLHLKQKSPAHLIFLGSEAALAGAPAGAIYCAAKFGLRGFAQSLRAEARRSDLAVSIVHPGPVQTPFFDDLNFAPTSEPGSASDPESVAATLSFIIDSRVDSVIDEITLSPRKRSIARKRSKPLP